jgi:hypothetical protein
MLSSLGKLLKKVLSKLMDFIKKILKKLWPLLIIIAIIYFAPLTAGYLSSIGAPSFLTSTFTWVAGNVTPLLSTTLSSLWSGGKALLGSAYSAFGAASTSTKLSLLSGAAALLAPEETAEFIGDVGSYIADTATTVLGAIAGTLFSNPIILIGGGLALWWLLSSKDSKETIYVQ